MLKERVEYDVVDDLTGEKIVHGGWVLTAMGGRDNYHFSSLVELHAALTYQGDAIFEVGSNMFIPSRSTWKRTLPATSPHADNGSDDQ